MPADAPDPAQAKLRICLDEELKASGTVSHLLHHVWSHDSTDVELLVFLPSTSTPHRWRNLEMSLSVRLVNESEPYADSRVVVKIPTVT